MAFTDEAQMQQLVEQLLATGRFAAAIKGARKVHTLAEPAPDVLPIFAIDHVARAAMIQAASGVLRTLGDLTILTGDKNISMQKGETLRPDFVCVSEETRSVFLIELKKSSQTAREAITELVGYEHEVKNYLPFLADYDLNFILISAEWSVLLDHSASSACCWSGKKLLCLEADLVDGELVLEPRIPEAWTITGATEFPRESLTTFQISFDAPNADEDGDPDPRLMLAMRLLAASGDRSGAHGFAMLWRDGLDATGKTFHITACGVDPVAFFNAAVARGMVVANQGHLVEGLSETFAPLPKTPPDSLFELVRSVKPILEEVAPVTIEGLFDWDTARETYRYRGEPLHFEFWGLLGDHARRYLTNPTVRSHRASLIGNGMIDWTHPVVGLFLLQSFRGQQFLKDGELRLTEAFEIGRSISLDVALRGLISDPEAEPLLPLLRPAFTWNAYETALLLEEVRLFALSVQSIGDPEEPLRFSLHPAPIPDDSMSKFVRWLENEVFRGQQLPIAAFRLGLRGGAILNAGFRDALGQSFADQRTALASQIAQFRQFALEICEEEQAARELTTEQSERLAALQSSSFADDDGIRASLRLIDAFLPAVAHQLNDTAPTDLDWTWLKQGVREMRALGKRPAVVLGADGTFGTMELTDPTLLKLGDVDDLEHGVLFLNNLSGIQMLLKTTWAELEEGKHFPVRAGA